MSESLLQTPSSKRRRQDEATARLSKPFRSPLLKKPDGTPTRPALSSPTARASVPAETPSSLRKLTLPPLPRPLFNATPQNSSFLNTIRRSASSPQITSDPEIFAAQKRTSELQAQIRTTRLALELAQQAAQLESSGEDAILEGEVWKWRLATREAAENIFGIASDRVNKFGGPKGDGWKILFGIGKKRRWDEEDMEEQRELRKQYIEEHGGDYEDWGIGGEDEKVEQEKKAAEPDEEWSMGVMLKCLGISDSMLGWDRENDCWINIDEMT